MKKKRKRKIIPIEKMRDLKKRNLNNERNKTQQNITQEQENKQ